MSGEMAEDARREADNLLRRLADQQLIDQLARFEFTGRLYQRFENELARYGLSVQRGWMHAGTIFRLTAERGYRLSPTEAELTELHTNADTRLDIAHPTVARALHRFRQKALVEGGWRVDAGASLATYFVGATVYEFPNQFRSWRAERERWRRQDRSDYLANGLREGDVTDPAVLAVGDIRVEDDLARATPREAEIIRLFMDGYTHEEIAELLGETSKRAPEGVMHRWRKLEKKRLEGNGGDQHG